MVVIVQNNVAGFVFYEKYDSSVCRKDLKKKKVLVINLYLQSIMSLIK